MASCVQRHLDVFGSVATVIMTVREKLEAYRRKRRREEMMQSIKNTVRSAFSWRRNDEIEKLAGEPTKDEEVRLWFPPHRFRQSGTMRVLILTVQRQYTPRNVNDNNEQIFRVFPISQR